MKDSIYFSHDADARNDERIIALRMAHGYEGYGIFWAIVELLRTATDHKMHMDSKCIAFALGVHNDIVQSVICDFNLFVIDDEGNFYSESLIRRMEKKKQVSETRRKAAKTRWNNANAMQVQSKSNANAMHEQCNKVKKESKERKKESNSYSDDAMVVAECLLAQIKTHKPDIKKPNLKKWAEEMDRAIRIDKRTPRDLCEVAKWAHTNTDDLFWRGNLLSAKKLRQQYDQISIKIKSAKPEPKRNTFLDGIIDD